MKQPKNLAQSFVGVSRASPRTMSALASRLPAVCAVGPTTNAPRPHLCCARCIHSLLLLSRAQSRPLHG